MNNICNTKKRNLLIVDLLIVLITAIALILNIKFPVILKKSFTLDTYVYSIALPLFVIAAISFGFGIYAEWKFNKLSLKNIILVFLAVIFFNNFLMNLIIPSHFVLVTYENINYTMDISIAQRFLSIINCGSVCFTTYLLIFVLPKLLYTKRFINIFLIVFICVAGIIVISSFFTDFDSYIRILKSGFTDYSKPVTSFLNSKFHFSLIIFIGIIASTIMQIITKKYRYMILAILFFVINIFTYSKLPILLSFLYLIVYFCVILFPICFRNKQNKIITLSCVSFALILCCVLIVMTVNSQTGILFKFKKILINVINGTKSTFSSRMTIWESAFKTLKPYQIIFGFGFYIGDLALHLSYSHNPHLAEDPSPIMHCHNAYIECIQLGGIIYLMFYLFLLFVLVKCILKIREKNKKISTLMLAIIAYILINGVVDSFILFSDPLYITFSIFISLLIMGFYYYYCDENELIRKKEILDDSKLLRNIKSDGLLDKFNKESCIFIGREIKQDKELIKRINKINL